jgi:hypothetical protein
MTKKILPIYLLLLTFSLAACQNKKMEEKFDWNPAHSAPSKYPVEPYRIHLVYADSNSVSWPMGMAGVGTDWGDDAGSAVVGADLKPAPVRLDISWLSLTEKQFYQGSFQLPYDTILSLFKKGFIDYNGEHDTYNQIIAGMAPGGIVVVWLSGVGHQVDVARFKAEPTQVAIPDFSPDSQIKDLDNYIKMEIETDSGVADAIKNVAQNGIPYGLWDRYRERFTLRPLIIYDQHVPVKTNIVSMDFYDGECDLLEGDMLLKNEFQSRARVKEISVSWTVERATNKKQSYQLDMNFNEAEMFKLYKELYDTNPTEQAELVVAINRGNDQYQIFLQSKEKKIELHQVTGEILLDNL